MTQRERRLIEIETLVKRANQTLHDHEETTHAAQEPLGAAVRDLASALQQLIVLVRPGAIGDMDPDE